MEKETGALLIKQYQRALMVARSGIYEALPDEFKIKKMLGSGFEGEETPILYTIDALIYDMGDDVESLMEKKIELPPLLTFHPFMQCDAEEFAATWDKKRKEKEARQRQCFWNSRESWEQLESLREEQSAKIAQMMTEVQYALVEHWAKGEKTEDCPASDSDMCSCCPLDPGPRGCWKDRQ